MFSAIRILFGCVLAAATVVNSANAATYTYDANTSFTLMGSVANPAAVRRDEVRAGGSSRVGLQGTPLRGRDRALGGALVLSLRGELPRPRADDGRTRRLGRPLDDFPMGPEVRSGDREAPTLAVAPATL